MSFEICKFVSIHCTDSESLFRRIACKTSQKCIRNSAVKIFLPLYLSIVSRYSSLETRAAEERNYFHPAAMLHASNYPIDKIVIQRDGKRALHNADIWSESRWIFQRIRNENSSCRKARRILSSPWKFGRRIGRACHFIHRQSMRVLSRF